MQNCTHLSTPEQTLSQLYMQTNEYITQHFRATADNEVYLHN